MPRILITNDDGIHSPGIISLERQLRPLGEITVVAPSHEMSAASRAITLTRPLRIDKIDEHHYSVDGTPVDCVTLAMAKILTDHPPDLIVSGINRGANLGDDVLYSGTVAGAAEAIIYGLPGVAFSLQGRGELNFEPAAEFAARMVHKVLHEGLPERTVLNINIPQGDIRGVRWTRQGNKIVRTRIMEGSDPRGRKYYWIGEEVIAWNHEDGTDYQAIRDGYISITPLQSNLTNFAVLSAAASWNSLTYEYQPLESQAS
jgi:5'-nucleotidase